MPRVAPYRFPNGRSKYRRPTDFDPAALRRGMRVEAEHSSDPRVQLRIAMDHLTEDPRYYEKLAKAHLGRSRSFGAYGYEDEDCALTSKAVRATGGALLGGGIGFSAAHLISPLIPTSPTNPLEAWKLKGVLYVGLTVMGAIAGSSSLAERPECAWS
jgi:hypothetical protein